MRELEYEIMFLGEKEKVACEELSLFFFFVRRGEFPNCVTYIHTYLPTQENVTNSYLPF